MTDSRNAILAIDEGTSGTRAAIVDASGHVSCLEYLPLQVDSPRPGVVEQDANAILDKTLAVCRATLARAREQGVRIVALALATQRATAALWDTRTGRALVPAMVWQDTRHAVELDRLGEDWNRVLVPQVGRPAGVRSPYLWAVHQMRSSQAVADAYRAGCLAFGTIDTWLLWHLSDTRECVTTPTNATSASAYLIGEHRYFDRWLDALGFPRELLPALRDDAEAFGRTRKDLLGIDVPILACVGDQFAGAIGLGCVERGHAMCVHGTGSFVDLLTGTTRPDAGPHVQRDHTHDGTLAMTARRHGGVSHYSLETFVATTGSALRWVCEKLRWFDAPSQISQLAGTVPSARGVTFVPALTGLRVPRMEPNARAVLSGISIATTQAEVAYAVLEGIAHSVSSCLEANQAVARADVAELIVGGGLAGSDTLLQIQSDVSGVPVRRMRDGDCASLRGAAFLAGASGLLWASLDAARATLVTDAVFEPSIDADSRQRRRATWHARIASELAHAADFAHA
ncbi:FGGY family carbohydrate kinase [Burkholderia anthina]|uniref:FGGY family carbohydrate kinase n=1 Tax=Burkholderia anthina TaxID=179879 RepID=UPI0037C0954A